MRLWSIHPQYLDAKGLVALWREGLLAQRVLMGLTRGYRQHPQLMRFQATDHPVGMIGAYLHVICDEAERRSYVFDRRKILQDSPGSTIVVTSGQIAYEWQHLKRKLAVRDRERLKRHESVRRPRAHPLFRIRKGPVAQWERT